MRTDKAISQYFKAIIERDHEKERKLYFKILKKSLKGKDTQRCD
jgi:hypothetical protein